MTGRTFIFFWWQAPFFLVWINVHLPFGHLLPPALGPVFSLLVIFFWLSSLPSSLPPFAWFIIFFSSISGHVESFFFLMVTLLFPFFCFGSLIYSFFKHSPNVYYVPGRQRPWWNLAPLSLSKVNNWHWPATTRTEVVLNFRFFLELEWASRFIWSRDFEFLRGPLWAAGYVIKEMRLHRAPPTQLQTEDLDF